MCNIISEQPWKNRSDMDDDLAEDQWQDLERRLNARNEIKKLTLSAGNNDTKRDKQQ